MRLPLTGPTDLIRTAREAARWSVQTATFVVELPGRAATLLDNVEVLVQRISLVVDEAARIVHETAPVVDGAAAVSAKANTVVESAATATATAEQLLELYQPLAVRAAPLATRFVDELSEDEIRAAITLVDQLPELTDRMTALMPILTTLDTVSPEIHELLGVAKDVRQAVTGVPGFNYFRKRGEDKNGD